ncbi:uncharacterized protein Dwil_GK24409 [Drosophila willistoni]|uniref:Bromo domain-containing protein n=1 Tax=Drosophila willistoni TaxID=7260 RepID=B4N0U7_DROWI|nr:bromodomain-containing protein 7 [Drosophila willistoni]EDW77710.1 uncharacterized protein Dwil_GK24409 [Drosophila willistoni]
MGSSKKHKKNKSERREKYEEYSQHQDPKQLQRGLKLILKVGSNATPEYNAAAQSPPTAAEAMMSPEPEDEMQMQGESGAGAAAPGAGSSHHRHKKSKKKKKKKEKEREKKHHKHHHKEKRHKSREREREKEKHRQDDNEMEDDEMDESVHVKNEVSTVANDENDSSQDGFSFMDEEQSQNILYYAGITTDNSPSSCPVSKPIKACKLDDSPLASPSTTTNTTISTLAASPTKPLPELIIPSPGVGGTGGLSGAGGGHTPKTPQSQAGSESGREPRSCVLKLKQQKSPLNKLLDHLLRFLEKRDPHQFFAWPVTDDIAPGYSSIITKPMDFSTMRQKIDDHDYSALNEFTDDFRRMCENAIRYNHVDTVYHKAAKRLLQLGIKYLQPENLMRSLKPLSGYMRELTAKELGFEMAASAHDLLNYDHHHQPNDSNNEDDDDEMVGAPPTPAQLEEEERKRLLRLENAPKTHFEPYVDDLTGEEILSQVQTAALKAKQRLKAQKKSAHKMGFLRQHKDGSTTLNLLISEPNEGPERVVTIGDLVGKLQTGSTQLQQRQSDPRNIVKTVKPLNYGTFASFAPTFDSRFSTLSKEETQLVLQTYGDASSAEYAESILQFTKDSSYGTHIANGLLDILTNGEHSKSLDELYNMQLQNHEQREMDKCFQSRVPEQSANDIELEYEKYKNVRFDFKRLHSLHDDLGIDMSFLNQMETDMKQFELSRRMQEHLSNNLTLIEKLRLSQQERLSQPLPSHLGLIPQPGPEETLVAQQVQQQLSEMAKKLPPSAIADPYSLRKAMGMSYAGLPPLTPSNAAATIQLPELLQQPVALPQSLDIDAHVAGGSGAGGSAPTGGGDLENELREFLESGSGLHPSTLHPTDDGNNIVAQLLLN